MSGSPATAVLQWDALAEGPAEYRTPAVRPTLDEAKQWCHRLATSHYENFHVATFFLPKAVKPHFESIYAYCRVSDDLGDEVSDPATATRLLEMWCAMLDECYDAPERSRHPVFVALQETIRETDAPRELFARLLRAFRQDVVEDDERGRRYLPADAMERFGVTEEQIRARRFTPEVWRLMLSLVEETRSMLHEGAAISGRVDPELAATLTLFSKGGDAILDAIETQGFDVLKARPEVSKGKKLRLLAGALVGKMRGVFA